MKILDALCLVFGCASGFAWYRSLSPPFTDAFRPLGQCYNVAMGVVLGLLLTGGFRLFRSRRWGVSAVPPQPGHWLLGFGLAAILACAGAVGAYHGLILHGGGPETYAMFGPPYWVPIQVAWYPTSFGLMHQGVGWSLGTAAALAFSWASSRSLSEY